MLGEDKWDVSTDLLKVEFLKVLTELQRGKMFANV